MAAPEHLAYRVLHTEPDLDLFVYLCVHPSGKEEVKYLTEGQTILLLLILTLTITIALHS